MRKCWLSMSRLGSRSIFLGGCSKGGSVCMRGSVAMAMAAANPRLQPAGSALSLASYAPSHCSSARASPANGACSVAALKLVAKCSRRHGPKEQRMHQRLGAAEAEFVWQGFRAGALAGTEEAAASSPGRGAVRCSVSARPSSQPRFIQHKKEAFWFYRFLSIVYDHIINPGHWTEDMREDALEPADLYTRDMVVVDVGGGTGFCTLGIVKHVDAKNVTILDQSPHQLAKAKEKEPLKDCRIMEGDAEDLPFETDYADRYVSAGSIEYWPDPQRGITEAYRVLKPGGKACLIGPVHPTFWLSRFFADVWMLFPTEEEYIDWFTKAGFRDVQLKRIGPKWYRGVRRHGLIMGCSVTGVKPAPGPSPLQLGSKAEDVQAPSNPLLFLYRFLVGNLAAFYYVLVPIYMWIKDFITPKGQPI